VIKALQIGIDGERVEGSALRLTRGAAPLMGLPAFKKHLSMTVEAAKRLDASEAR
jgi:hypothetical protein